MIREFDIDKDSKQVKAILEESFGTTVSFKNYNSGLGVKKLYVFEYNGKISSVISLTIVDSIIDGGSRTAILDTLATKSSCRKKGYGSLMIEDMIKRAKNRECDKVFLNCVDDLVPYYQKKGFVKDGNLMLLEI